jgi:arthrofactin-type cyclic lipopeptide synthetase B
LWSPDGELVVTGRSSSYLKYRGYRLSPEEIESCINTCDGVFECRVLVLDGRLVAEVVCKDAGVIGRIPSTIRPRLPMHALPEQFQRVDAVPRTASGKIKRH